MFHAEALPKASHKLSTNVDKCRALCVSQRGEGF
ncbi:hypothetical protein C809_01902 [Lachnospiraceae bacterium MD335]|nr:hypothetical protein C809_01902 [Lachnospiraceae bacterium MD335]